MFDLRPPLPPAELFSGDYTYPVEQFLTVLEATFPLMNFDTHDEHKLAAMKTGYLAMFLTGRARLWFTEHMRQRELAVHPFETYEHLRTLLIQVFGGHTVPVLRHGSTDGTVRICARSEGADEGEEAHDHRQADRKFSRMVQRNTVRLYADRYLAASKECGFPIDLNTDYECLWFIYGLKPQIRDEALRTYHPGMTFQGVVLMAEDSEQQLFTRTHHRSASKSGDSRSGSIA